MSSSPSATIPFISWKWDKSYQITMELHGHMDNNSKLQCKYISTLPSFTRNDNANIFSNVWAKDALFNTRNDNANIFSHLSVGSASCMLRHSSCNIAEHPTIYIQKYQGVSPSHQNISHWALQDSQWAHTCWCLWNKIQDINGNNIRIYVKTTKEVEIFTYHCHEQTPW
jgi:hypothetical protein